MISYLTKYHGEATAGIYQSGFLIICSYAGLLFNAISLEYFPRLSQIASRPKMASVAVSHEIAIAMYVLVPVVIVFLAADRLILRLLFSSEFMVALPMITVGITMLIFRGISFCLAIVILARGEGRTYIITESLSSVIGLALNISFFHYWGYLGVAVSFIIWYFIYCIITGVVYYRNFGMRLTPGVIRLIVFSIVVTPRPLPCALWHGGSRCCFCPCRCGCRCRGSASWCFVKERRAAYESASSWRCQQLSQLPCLGASPSRLHRSGGLSRLGMDGYPPRHRP